MAGPPLSERLAEPAPILPTVEPLPASAPIPTSEDDMIDQGWEVGATAGDTSGVMLGDDAVLEASLDWAPARTGGRENPA